MADLVKVLSADNSGMVSRQIRRLSNGDNQGGVVG